MSGGGGSGSDGSNDTDVSGAEAVATGGSTYSDRKIDNSVGYTSQDNVREQQRGDNQYYNRTQAAQVDAEDEYDAPDKDHFNQTQKEIRQKSKDVVDTTMSKEQYDQFNKEMNKYYGTENVKYEPYGRAGKGTVNLTFKEHFDNVGMQSPFTKYSPLARFLIASGRNAKEFLTSDYGTYKYGGPGTDQGGLLGRIGGSGADISLGATQGQRDVMNELAPEAPYIVSGLTRPTNSLQLTGINH